MKRIQKFTMELKRVLSYGNLYEASGYIDGCYYTTDGVFLYYPKRQVEKLLKEKLREKAK